MGMFLIEHFIKWVPSIGKWLETTLAKYWKRDVLERIEDIRGGGRRIKSSILLRRVWDDKAGKGGDERYLNMTGRGGGSGPLEH